jgi:hypothetical protein
VHTDVVSTVETCAWRTHSSNPLILLEGARPDATGEHDDGRLGDLLKGGIDRYAEHAVLGAYLPASMTDDGHIDLRNALEHLVGPDAVEGGEPGKHGYDNLQAIH